MKLVTLSKAHLAELLRDLLFFILVFVTFFFFFVSCEVGSDEPPQLNTQFDEERVKGKHGLVVLVLVRILDILTAIMQTPGSNQATLDRHLVRLYLHHMKISLVHTLTHIAYHDV